MMACRTLSSTTASGLARSTSFASASAASSSSSSKTAAALPFLQTRQALNGHLLNTTASSGTGSRLAGGSSLLPDFTARSSLAPLSSRSQAITSSDAESRVMEALSIAQHNLAGRAPLPSRAEDITVSLLFQTLRIAPSPSSVVDVTPISDSTPPASVIQMDSVKRKRRKKMRKHKLKKLRKIQRSERQRLKK